MKKMVQLRNFVVSRKGKAFTLKDVAIPGMSKPVLALLRLGEIAVIDRLTFSIGKREVRTFVATDKLYDPSKPVTERTVVPRAVTVLTSLRTKIREFLKTIPEKTEFTYEAFLPLAPERGTTIRVSMQELRRMREIHLVRVAKPRKGVRQNVYCKGPPYDAEQIIPRYETSRTPFDRCDLSGWREVSPWMFTPTNLPKGKIRNHKLEMS